MDPSNQRARESNKSHCIRMPRKSKGDCFLSSLAKIGQQLHEDFPVPFHLRIKLELMKYIRLICLQSRARTKQNNECHRKDRINESLIDAIYFCRSCSQSCLTDRLFTRYSTNFRTTLSSLEQSQRYAINTMNEGITNTCSHHITLLAPEAKTNYFWNPWMDPKDGWFRNRGDSHQYRHRLGAFLSILSPL